MLEWDERDYRRLINDTDELMATPRFKQAYRAITRALQHTDRLDEHDLQRLLEPVHKTFATRWVVPEPLISDRSALQTLRDRDAAARRNRTQQAARRQAEAKRMRAEMLELEQAMRAQEKRRRISHDLDQLARGA